MAEPLKTRLQSDLNLARKNRDRGRTLVLSTTLAELKNLEIETGRDAGDDDATLVLTRAIKRRREAADQMRVARPELAEKEEGEAEILKAYLPESLSEAEVRAIIREAIAGGASQMGPLMGKVMPRLKGRFDGKEANRLVREELAGAGEGRP
jgi:uncharacterized protein YqeY